MSLGTLDPRTTHEAFSCEYPHGPVMMRFFLPDGRHIVIMRLGEVGIIYRELMLYLHDSRTAEPISVHRIGTADGTNYGRCHLSGDRYWIKTSPLLYQDPD